MEDKLNKNTDSVVKKAMQYVELSSPTDSFTDNVMAKIEALKTANAKVFKPLISTNSWVTISLFFIGVIVYSYYLSEFDNSTIMGLANIEILTAPDAATNLIIVIGVVLLVQLTVLKNYFNNRLSS